MPTLDDRLKLLSREPAGATAAVLAAALPHAEPGERDRLAEAALDTASPDALAAVIGCLHELRSAVLTRLSRAPAPAAAGVGQALRIALGSRTPQTVINALAVVRHRADTDVLGLLVPLLGHADEDVRRTAARTLVAVVVAHVGPEGRRRVEAGIEEPLDRAVAAAAATYEAHRSRDVMLAAALLAGRRGSRLARMMAEGPEPVQLALRGVPARDEDALVRANLLRWISVKTLGGSVARALERIGERPNARTLLNDILVPGHLLLARARRRAMRRIDRPARCLPPRLAPPGAADPIQVNLVRLIRTLPLTDAQRRDRLADCAELPCSVARLNALDGLLRDGTPEADRMIETMCFDRAEAIAFLAARRVGLKADLGAELRRRMERSPHPIIARRSRSANARRDPEAFFARWLEMDPTDRAAAAHGLLARHRGPMVRGLRDALGESRDSALAAVALCRRLRLVGDLEPQLIDLIDGADRHAASAAVSALGDDAADRCRDALEGALAHADPRVRANALEALVRFDRTIAGSIGHHVASHDSRLRANAVRAMLRGGQRGAVESLRAMLDDPDPRHRVSGVWVAGRTRLAAVTVELKSLAATDPFEEIRTRAAKTVNLLKHQSLSSLEAMMP